MYESNNNVISNNQILRKSALRIAYRLQARKQITVLKLIQKCIVNMMKMNFVIRNPTETS